MNILDPIIIENGVMVIEDSVVQRSFTVAKLGKLGVTRITEAAEGEAALRLLESLSPCPAVLIVDLEMPVMDGVELIHRLSQLKIRPALIVSSSRERALIASVETMIRDLGMPLLGVLGKPVNEEALASLLSKMESPASQTTQRVSEVASIVSVDELRDAITRRAVIPYFQPKVDLNSGQTTGVEALARWIMPNGVIIPPDRFIQVAEQNGLMNELTLSILDQSLEALRSWEEVGHSLSISINLSPSSLGDMQLANAILQRVESSGISYEKIVLEITESVMMENPDALRDLIRLRLRGFGLSIDDYGTGFSSMQQLPRIPFSELKIDRAFVDGASQRENLRAILESAIALGKRLGLTTVAEGVEREADWQLLKDLGCDSAQGYLLSRPVPGEHITDVIERLAKRRQTPNP